MDRLNLPQVTLCCVDCTARLPLAIDALERCVERINFGACVLLTDVESLKSVSLPSGVQGVGISPLRSIEEYSHFVVKSLSAYVHTSHVLIIQWDGFVVNSAAWSDEFLEFDYVGAPWRHLGEVGLVGNGGFSLRSMKLLRALQNPAVEAHHPEDICICQTYREYLEARGVRFAPVSLAARFAVENDALTPTTFGFHSPRHLPQVLGPEQTLRFICSLDGRVLEAYFFGTLLVSLQTQAQADWRYQVSLTAFERLLVKAVSELGSERSLSQSSVALCKALIGYGQFDAARHLLRFRSAERGHAWPDARLWVRLMGRLAASSFGF